MIPTIQNHAYTKTIFTRKKKGGKKRKKRKEKKKNTIQNFIKNPHTFMQSDMLIQDKKTSEVITAASQVTHSRY